MFLIGKRRLNWAASNDDGSWSKQDIIEVDFGSSPGAATASVQVSDQTGLKVASKSEAWLDGSTDASDGTTKEQHRAEAPFIHCTTGVVSGADGHFTIYVQTPAQGLQAARSISTGTGAGNLDTTLFTSPSLGTAGFLIWGITLRLRQTMTGSGSIVVTVGLTAGGTEFILTWTITSGTAAGTVRGLRANELGARFVDTDGSNAKMGSAEDLILRAAKSGSISQQAIIDVEVYGGPIALA